MYGVEENGWLKTYVFGELTWLNIELFECEGRVETSDTLDVRMEKAEDKTDLEILMPVLYSSKRLRPEPGDLVGTGLEEEYSKRMDDPDMDFLLKAWELVWSRKRKPTALHPTKEVPTIVAVKYVLEWLERNPEKVERFLKAVVKLEKTA